MASAADVIAALDKFELDLIEKQWSDDIWTSEFTSCPDDISEDFADKFSTLSYCDIVQVIEQADKVINLWLSNCMDISATSDAELSNSSVMGPSWTLLQDVDYKRLLSLLYFYICKGHLNNQDTTSVHICVKATNFYFTLLIIPGSNIYKIFHLTLFEKCLETFSLHKFLEIATGRKIKKTKATRKSEEFSSDDEFLEMDETLTLSQQQNVVKQLNFLLSTFKQFVTKFSFKKYPEALNMSLNTLAELTRIERSSTLHEFSTNNTNTSFVPLSRNAYLTMKDFCSTLHGRVPEIIRLVLFYLMPNLTSIGGIANPEMNKLSQKELSNIRSIAVFFITDNIIPLGADAQVGLKILIQQLCFNMIDRADYRSKATEMVITILCKLPMDLYYSLLKWIFRLSMMEGAHHRVISLELLSKLIFMKPGTEELSKLTDSQYQHFESQLQNSENVTVTRTESHQKTDYTSSLTQEPIISFSQPVNYVPLEYRRVMFAIIVDRIRDEAAIVRTRALSILSEIISNKTSQALQIILRDVFLHPYSEVSSIGLNVPNEENEFLKWKTFVTLLDKVREANVVRSMLPGARIIVNKVFEKCLDDKVNVRKAALQVISSIFKFSSKWMTDDALKLFGKHCRDPALSIRKEMLNCITELMLFFPDHEPLMELWVEEVVPLIMDREIKVQEQALQIFTNTILSKITAFNKIKTSSDELPWKLLDKIAKQNKRSFLMTACALWSESSSLNQSLITALKSHIGTVNDAPVWVFLACISEYFDIEKPEFVMAYYMDVLAKDAGDMNSSYLALLTLSTSWQKLPKDKKEALQIEMFSKLKSFSVSPTFVGLTVEIVAGIAVYIAEDELAGKKEVAKWGIEMIQDCETHLENCLKVPKDKRVECNDCGNILALLGALVGICPDKIKHPTFLLLFNYLMDSKSGGSPHDRKMRAVAVITLSKMALQSDLLARSLVTGLAQLLAQSSDPVVLNNVIVAIADIGESYANLIEPLIPFICVCLKSQHKSLKEITLVLLIELLQEDYLKARGALVFHLLTMVNDPNPWLVNIVKYYFTNSLLARNPYKMYQLLLPGLFHLNNYTNHPDYPRLEMTDAEMRAFDLAGPENHSQRMNVYQFMLSNVPDMVKMKCLHFICTVVLNGAADNIIAIKSRDGEQLLFDALCILLTPEIKIEYNDLVKRKNEDGEEEDDQKQNPLYKLGKQMFTAAQKKEIIETIIPICCKLKKKLLMENKKLLPYLHKFVRELVKDYKSEINEIFKEDKQFGVEILHELDKIANSEVGEEEEENEEEVAVALDGGDKSGVETFMSAVRKERTERRTSKSGGTLPSIPELSMEQDPGNRSNESNPSDYVQVKVVLERLDLNQLKSPEGQMEKLDADTQPVSSQEKQNEGSEKEVVTKETAPLNNLQMRVELERLDLSKLTSPEKQRKIIQNPVVCLEKLDTEPPNEGSEKEVVTKETAPLNNLQVRVELERLDLSKLTSPEKQRKIIQNPVVCLEKLDTEPPNEGSEKEVVTKETAPLNNLQVRVELERLDLSKLTSPEKQTKIIQNPVVCLEKLDTEPPNEGSEKETITEPEESGHGEKSKLGSLPKLVVSLQRLTGNFSKEMNKKVEKDREKRSRKEPEEERMEEAIHDIVMPPPLKVTTAKSKKHSFASSIINKTPTTPITGGRKELLTSTPLVTVNITDFTMDISAVVSEEATDET